MFFFFFLIFDGLLTQDVVSGCFGRTEWAKYRIRKKNNGYFGVRSTLNTSYDSPGSASVPVSNRDADKFKRSSKHQFSRTTYNRWNLYRSQKNDNLFTQPIIVEYIINRELKM